MFCVMDVESSMQRSMLVLELQTWPCYHYVSLRAAYGRCEDLEIPHMWRKYDSTMKKKYSSLNVNIFL